jgi:putative DNA methylase
LGQTDVHQQIDLGSASQTLLAAIAEKNGQRVFLDSSVAVAPLPSESPDLSEAPSRGTFGSNAQGGRYGFARIVDHFSRRQQLMLESFATNIAELTESLEDALKDRVYAETIAAVLGLGMGRLAQAHNMQVRWKLDSRNGSASAQAAFGTHAVQMVWSYAEMNPFGGSVGDWMNQFVSMFRGLRTLPEAGGPPASVAQRDARQTPNKSGLVIVTDPPYFNQVAYADLSDHMYVWIRDALRGVFPDLFATIAAPKSGELIAAEHRHDGSKQGAYDYFVRGFTETFKALKTVAAADNPILIVYAHRQEESSSLGTASTGWDAMLEAVLAAGLTIEGTLPIRGTGSSRQIGQGTNSLASYIVMVCRPRAGASIPATIADFRGSLRKRLPSAADALLGTGESMVDIRQAAIGPGMEVFSQFSQVFDGSEPIPVRRALSIINEELGRILDEHLGVVDDETRWACQWYADHGFETGEYDEGRKLAQTYGLGVDGLQTAGIVEQGRGRIRLLSRADMDAAWIGDDRTPAWKACQQLVRRLTDGESAGEQPAAALLAVLGSKAGGVRELAQYLSNLAIEKGWSDEAIAYDALVKSWPRIEELAAGAEADPGKLFAE